MNALELRLEKLDSGLLSNFKKTLEEVDLLLSKYSENFPTYTDHSIKHTKQVFEIASQMLTKDEIDNLNGDEIYVLSMACILHDVGMCIPETILLEKFNSDRYKKYRDSSPKDTEKEILIRDIHHELSHDFIIEEQESLSIPNNKFAEAIALVSMGHRKVRLDDTSRYKPKFFVKNGRDFVCLPYLASILRLADELDITNIRTPKLLTKYYLPNNELSIKEWKKHISTTQINYTEDKVIFEVSCSDQNNLAALEDQFEKIQDVANYAQKIIRNIANTDGRTFSLSLTKVVAEYHYIGFDPKGIKFSFNVNNVVNTFIGKDLYQNELTGLREAVQNAIDSCRYKKSLQANNYEGKISIDIKEESITISDNGLGMDEFIIENFFGKLGSSYYSEEKIKNEFEAIGQFGVGVFSYFLLAEFIDIETKTINSKTLKFRIDKDPKNYFHFYDSTSRIAPGTSITFHLSEQAQKHYSFSSYVNFLKKTFLYIEIPIIINGQESATTLIGNSPTCLKEKEIYEKIKIQNRNKIHDLETISVRINNDILEGECSLIVPKLNKECDLSSLRHLFDPQSFISKSSRSEFSSIRLSQKGVFVERFGSEILNYTVGQVNFKKGQPINISRNEFSNNEDISKLLAEFFVKLIEKLFAKLSLVFEKSELVKLSHDFLKHYFGRFYQDFEEYDRLKTLFVSNIHLNVYSEQRDQIMSVDQLLKMNNEFALISELEDKKSICKALDLPLVIAPQLGQLSSSFDELEFLFSRLFHIPSKIVSNKGRSYLIFGVLYEEKVSNEVILKLNYLTEYKYSSLLKFDSPIIATSLYHNKTEWSDKYIYYFELYLNIDHIFIKFIISLIGKVENDIESQRIIREAFDLIFEITTQNEVKEKGIKQLNEIIVPLFSGHKLFRFKKEDFVKIEKETLS